MTCMQVYEIEVEKQPGSWVATAATSTVREYDVVRWVNKTNQPIGIHFSTLTITVPGNSESKWYQLLNESLEFTAREHKTGELHDIELSAVEYDDP